MKTSYLASFVFGSMIADKINMTRSAKFFFNVSVKGSNAYSKILVKNLCSKVKNKNFKIEDSTPISLNGCR
jgi:hypothetical protein